MTGLFIAADREALRIAWRPTAGEPPVTATVPWSALTALFKRSSNPQPPVLGPSQERHPCPTLVT